MAILNAALCLTAGLELEMKSNFDGLMLNSDSVFVFEFGLVFDNVWNFGSDLVCVRSIRGLVLLELII